MVPININFINIILFYFIMFFGVLIFFIEKKVFNSDSKTIEKEVKNE